MIEILAYEVDAVLVGETVILRYDPAAPPTRPLAVVHQGKADGQAAPLDTYANTAVRRDRVSWRLVTDTRTPKPPPSRLTLRGFTKKEND